MDARETAGDRSSLRSRGETVSVDPSLRRNRLALLGLLLCGFLVRAAYAYPAHKYVPDADSLNMGLRALSILQGDVVVFYSGAQIGALEAYLHAPLFALFGASRETIALAPLFVGFLTLVVFYLFTTELFGPRVGALSLLFLALPSPVYLAWTYMPNSYPETVLLCVTILWIAARLRSRGLSPAWLFAFGLAAGIGWWNSPLTLGCTLPAVAWLSVVRPEVRRIAPWKLPAAGFVLGALPWIAYNLRYRFPSFFQVVRPASEVGSVSLAAKRLFGENVPQLAVGMDPFGPGNALNDVQLLARIPSAIVIAAAVAFLAIRAGKGEPGERRSVLLLWLVTAATAGLFVFSASGTFPGPTVRYVLPLAFILAAALGLAADFLARRSRLAALLVVLPVLVFNLSGYYWPWTANRREWALNRQRETRVLQFLEANGVSWVFGEYWTVYPFNFLSGGRLKAVPSERQFDFYGIGSSLPSGRLALVSNSRWIEEWADRSDLAGPVSPIAPGYLVLLPAGIPSASVSPQRLYEKLLTAARGP